MISALHNDVHVTSTKACLKNLQQKLEQQSLYILKYQTNSTENLVAAAQKCHREQNFHLIFRTKRTEQKSFSKIS